MEFSQNDIEHLEKFFDDRYVIQEDCNTRQNEVNKKFSNDDKRIEIISHDFGAIKKILWIVATSMIGVLVTSILNLILR